MSSAEWVQQVMTPRAEDSVDVRWACETASALWSRGEREQALQWIHHAIQAATSEGQHQRADDLDRVAQELEHLPLPRPRSASPSAPAPASTTSPSVEHVSPRPKLARTAPYKLAPDDITYLEAPSSVLLQACEPSAEAPRLEPNPNARAAGSTHAGVGPEALGSSPTHAGVGPEPQSDKPALPARPMPPAPAVDPETTMVNRGVKPRQERTMVMDMRGFTPGAVEPGAVESRVAPPERAAPAPPAPAKSPVPASPASPAATPKSAIPPQATPLMTTAAPSVPKRPPPSNAFAPASLLRPVLKERPITDFEQTVERRAPILDAEQTDVSSALPVASSLSAALSSAANSEAVGAPTEQSPPAHDLDNEDTSKVLYSAPPSADAPGESPVTEASSAAESAPSASPTTDASGASAIEPAVEPSAPPSAGTSSAPPISTSASSAPVSAGASSAPLSAGASSAPPSAGASSAPGTVSSPNLPLESMRALRVAVTAGSGRELRVTLLDDTDPLPDNAQEAFLLPIKRS